MPFGANSSADLPGPGAAVLHALIESSSAPVWVVDLEHRVIAQNAAATPFLSGISGARTWTDLYARTLREGSFNIEHQLSGDRVFDLSFNPLRQHGALIGISVFGADVTARVREVRAAHSAEADYRAFFERAIEGIYRVSPECSLLAANPAFARMLLYDSPDDATASIRSTTTHLWVDPDDRDNIMLRLDESGEFRDYECRFRRKDGSSVWVSLSGRTVRDAAGEILYFEGSAEDITDRKRILQLLRVSENEARQREEFLRMVLDATPAFVITLDGAGRIAMMNPAALETLQYRLEDVTGASFLDLLVPPEEHGNVHESFERLRRWQHMHCENHILSSTGRRRLVEWFGRPVIGPDGRTEFFVGVGVDITERRAIEAALRQSEEKFAKAFLQSPAAKAIIEADGDRRLIDVNAAFERMLGYTRDEVLGLPVENFHLWPGGDSPATHSNAEVRFVRKDGSSGIGRMSTTGVEIAGRNCLIAFILDITAEHAAAGELRASERRFRGIFDSAFAMMGLLSPEGILLEANRTALAAVGRSRDEVIGMPFVDTPWVGHSQGLQRQVAEMVAGARRGEVQFGETDLPAADGRTLRVEFTFKPIFNEQGEVVLIIPEGRDISRIYALSGRLLSAQEEERRRIARELHDDLSQQIAAASLITASAKRQIPESLVEARAACSRVQEKLIALAEGVRKLSHQLHPSVLQHSGLIAALRSHCAEYGALSGHAITFTSEGPCDQVPPPVALCVYRVTQEALQNSVRHSQADSASVKLSCAAGRLLLEVSDSGVGMTAQAAGGLGMVSMKERARLVHGSIEVQSGPGAGVRLTLAVPLH